MSFSKAIAMLANTMHARMGVASHFRAPLHASRTLVARRQIVTSAAAASSDGRVAGTVKWFNSTKGYGFISPSDGGADVFVHQTSILSEGFRSLAEGESVEFVVNVDNTGRSSAKEVTGPNGAQTVGSTRPRPEGQDRGYGRDGGYGGGGRRQGGGGFRDRERRSFYDDN